MIRVKKMYGVCISNNHVRKQISHSRQLILVKIKCILIRDYYESWIPPPSVPRPNIPSR